MKQNSKNTWENFSPDVTLSYLLSQLLSSTCCLKGQVEDSPLRPSRFWNMQPAKCKKLGSVPNVTQSPPWCHFDPFSVVILGPAVTSGWHEISHLDVIA